MVFVLLIITLSYSAFWLYRSYQIGIKHQLNLVKDWGGKPLQNPENYRIALALIYLVSSLALTIAAFVLIAAKLPFQSWWVVVLLGQFYVIAHNFIAWRAKKNAS